MKSETKEKDEDTTWVVLLVVFGLAGVGGPIIALILFFLLRILN